MKKTLQDQYLSIKEGKGHKGVFLTEAKRQFPNIVRNAATFDEAVSSLKTKNIISENVLMVMPAVIDRPKKESYETAFEAFLAEAKKKKDEDENVKAEEKKVSKPVEKDLEKNFDYSDEKNPDNMIFDQIMMGYYAEMKDPKNADKTMQELKDIVFKNLSKDPIHYTKDGQFGIKDLGYVTEAPGLGEPKEPKGKYKSSGYGDLKESIQPINEEDKLRKVIREMIDAELEEAYQLVNIRPRTSDKEREERDPVDQYPAISSKLEDFLRSRKYLRFSGDKIVILSRLIEPMNFLRAVKNDVDLTPTDKEFVKFLSTSDNVGTTFKLPSEGIMQDYTLLYNVKPNRNGKLSFFKPAPKKEMEEGVLGVRDTDVSPGYPVDLPISYSDDKNVAHYSDDDRYSSQEDLLDPEDYLEQIQGMSDGDAFNYLKGLGLGRGEILTVLKSRKSSLRESVEKDLADINKEAEHEVLQTKLDKIDALIDLRRSKLGKLDEDEDMKALTDKKKVKELEKDIKKLEVARNKVEKMMSKFKGKKSSDKKVIDEDEPIDENIDVDLEYIEDSTERLDAGQKVDSIRDTYDNLGIDQKSDLTDYLNTIAPDDLKSDYVY